MIAPATLCIIGPPTSTPRPPSTAVIFTALVIAAVHHRPVAANRELVVARDLDATSSPIGTLSAPDSSAEATRSGEDFDG